MKISIIIPVYNVEEYLCECLDSVLNQDLDDYEIICVNDKSTDNSLKILCEYACKYHNIKVIEHDVNRGLSATRNTGIRNATGKYLQFVDSDDMIKPNTCKLLYEKAEEYEADIVYFNMEFLNNEALGLIRAERKEYSFDGLYDGPELFCKYHEQQCRKPEAVRHFIRRTFFIQKKLWFYEGIIHEDMLFSFLAAMNAKRVIDINERLYIYRQRAGSIMWGNKSKSVVSEYICVLKMCNYLLDNKLSTSTSTIIKNYISYCYYGSLHHKLYNGIENSISNSDIGYVYDLLNTNNLKSVSFNKEDIVKICTASKVVVYGAGLISRLVIIEIKKMQVFPEYIVVTSLAENDTNIYGIQVKKFETLNGKKEYLFIMGTDEKYWPDISKSLALEEVKKIVFPQIM